MNVELATTEHEPGLRALFERCHSPCYCRYWHFTGNKNEWLDRCAHRPEENAAELGAALRSGDPSASGLVAREPGSGEIVGWMKLTMRAAVPKLRSLPVYRSLPLGPEDTTFVIGCFLVDPRFRKRGVARALVAAAIEVARERGARAIEAYPHAASPLGPHEVWMGPADLFASLGFRRVAGELPYPVLRRDV